MRYWLLLFSVLLLTSACVHVRPSETGRDHMHVEINRRAQTANAVLHLRDDRRIPAEGLYIGPNAASWIHPETGVFFQVPTREIQTVRFARLGRGALAGAVGGIAVGLIVGYLQTKSWSPAEEDCGERSTGRDGTWGARWWGLDAIAGVMVGQPVVYHLPTPRRAVK